MKYVFALLTLLWLGSCTKTNPVDHEAELNQMVAENDSLFSIIKVKNQELDEITNSMNRIEGNLAAIRRNEQAIENLKREGAPEQGEKIDQLIRKIDEFVEDNRRRVNLLENQMKTTRNQSAGLTRLVEQQKQNVFEKEQQIEFLLTTITSLKRELTSTIIAKNAEISSKQREIEAREATMATVYYTYGNRDELINEGVIRREGGVLGAGKTLKLAGKFDVEDFKKIDMKRVQEIDMGIVDRKNVITSHPAESYYFVKTSGRTYLKIVDYQKFWSISKFLVVETEGSL